MCCWPALPKGMAWGCCLVHFPPLGGGDVVFCPLAEGELLELRLGLALQVGGDYGTNGSAHEGDEPETTSQLRQIIAEAAHFLGTA